MPNHLHLLLHYSAQSGKSLNAIISNGKRFLAYDIVKRLEDQREYDLLQRLSKDVGTTDRKRGKKHEIWINSFDVKHCRTESFILQKLNYIHNNPCAGRWKLAESPIEYPHSSALFYLNGKIKSYPVKDYRLFVPYDDFDV
jgi:REP element-mobilizing transposase RayT